MAPASRKLNDEASTSVAFNQYGEEKSMLGDMADRPPGDTEPRYNKSLVALVARAPKIHLELYQSTLTLLKCFVIASCAASIVFGSTSAGTVLCVNRSIFPCLTPWRGSFSCCRVS
jgi:hypothetical protein